jgi:hypothetical protein
MPNIHHTKHHVEYFVDRWDSKLSVIIGLLLFAAFYLGKIGSERQEITRQMAEWIEGGCLLGGVLVGLLQFAVWIRKWTVPRPPDPVPAEAIPERDATEPGLVLKSPPFGFPKARFFIPLPDNLEWFVEWSEADTAIAEANDLPTYKRRLLYRNWYKADPRSFLVMQRKQTVGAIWETYALSIILVLPEEAVRRLKNHEMSVIDLHSADLHFPADERKGRYLLYDTFIIDARFHDRYSDFKRWHTLIHFAQFDLPASGREVSVFIEPDNPRLKISLNNSKKYGAHTKFDLRGEHCVHEFVFPFSGTSTVKLKDFERYWALLHAAKWLVPVGTH